MKPLKYILIALGAWFVFTSNCMGQDMNNDGVSFLDTTAFIRHSQYPIAVLEIPKYTKKDRQYQFTASTIYLMELYVEETKNDSIEVYGLNGMSMWTKIPEPKTFENFYYWTQQYFKDEKDIIHIVIE